MTSELEKLKSKYKKLKYKEMESQEKKRLRKEIWSMEHRGIRKTAGVIEGMGKGIVKAFKSAGKKISDYEKDINSQKVNKPGKLNKMEEYIDILP